MSEAITERVIETIARSQKVSAEGITLDTTFEQLGMTSLDALGLIFDLEEEFNVAIPNEEAMGLRNVRQAVESVRKLLSETVG
ncbi:MAG TPA: acyl carrier protein [Pyrinomonadaceae bacterium]|jgi:acyl carrier protein